MSNASPPSTASVTRKGQVTIPAAVRRALGLKPKDRVAFILTDGGAIMRPAPSALDRIAGSVKPRKKPEDFKELRDMVKDELAQRYRQEGR